MLAHLTNFVLGTFVQRGVVDAGKMDPKINEVLTHLCTIMLILGINNNH